MTHSSGCAKIKSTNRKGEHMRRLIITDETMQVETGEEKDMTFEDVLLLTMDGIGGAVIKISDATHEEHPEVLQQVREELFDVCNFQFSQFLNQLFPEISLRPNLTEEAILRAENEIIEEKAKEAGIKMEVSK